MAPSETPRLADTEDVAVSTRVRMTILKDDVAISSVGLGEEVRHSLSTYRTRTTGGGIHTFETSKTLPANGPSFRLPLSLERLEVGIDMSSFGLLSELSSNVRLPP